MAQTRLRWLSRPDSGFDAFGHRPAGGGSAGGSNDPCDRHGRLASGDRDSGRRHSSPTKIQQHTFSLLKNTKQPNDAREHDPPCSTLEKSLQNLNLSSDSIEEPVSFGSSASSTDYIASKPISLHVSSSSIDEFDGIAFRKRLFSREFCRQGGVAEQLAIEAHDFWMSLQIGDTLLVELGHGAMNGGKDQFVELVDEKYDDPDTNKIIVYFSKHRSDFQQLVNSFEIMDFDAMSAAAVSTQVCYDLNESNYFMSVSTEYSSSCDDSDPFDDLIDFD